MSVAHPDMAGETERLRTLYRLLATLNRARTLEDVLDAALASLLHASSADRAAILLPGDDGNMRFAVSRGLSAEFQAALTGYTPWPRDTHEAEPVIVPDVLADERLAAHREVLRTEGIRALMFVPLALDSGILGLFALYYALPYEGAGDEVEIARAIAAHVVLAIQHKRAEWACLASEQRLQAILDNSAGVVFVKDLDGRYVLVNRQFETLFHVTKSSVVGRTDHDIFPPEVADRFQANDRAVLAAGKLMSFEEAAPHDDGMHTYSSMKFPLVGPDGSVTGVCGIATDVTDRKRFEAAAQHLAAIVESSDDAIISKNLLGIVTSWNKGAERIFGYTRDEMVGQPVSTLAAPERLDEMPRILSSIKAGQRVEHYETRRRRKDGQIIDVSLTVSPVCDSEGRIVGASKIARDISDRKLIDQERSTLLTREQEARWTAELLYRLGNRLSAQLDLEKLVQEVTDIARSLVGAEFGAFFYNVADETGDSYMPYALSGVPREAFAEFPMPRKTLLLGPTFRGEGVVRCDDVTQDPRYGKSAPYFGMPEGFPQVRSYLAAPVVARSGEVLGGLFFGHSEPGKFRPFHEPILRDIGAQAAIALDNARLFTQTQRVLSELKRSNEELRRVNRDLEVFAYSASHDLQEPLRNIAISAQLLERSLGPHLQGHDATFLANVVTAARRMGALIEDLLAYTRATKYEEGPAPRVESGRVLANVLEAMRATIEEAGATVTSGTLPDAAIHEGRLAQVFQNLISNAIKYRGAEAPDIRIAAGERDGWCVFSIADNGIGIDPEYAEQIFGLFKRLHGSDKYPGSGIGLAICQRIVEQYGGRIWLEKSAPGSGSTFCFSVPAAA